MSAKSFRPLWGFGRMEGDAEVDLPVGAAAAGPTDDRGIDGAGGEVDQQGSQQDGGIGNASGAAAAHPAGEPAPAIPPGGVGGPTTSHPTREDAHRGSSPNEYSFMPRQSSLKLTPMLDPVDHPPVYHPPDGSLPGGLESGSLGQPHLYQNVKSNAVRQRRRTTIPR